MNSVGYKCKVKGKRMRLSVLVNKMLPCDFAPHMAYTAVNAESFWW